MAQWSVTFDLVSPTLSGGPSYLNRVLAHHKTSEPAMSADLQYIQEIMRRFRQLSPDGTECSCLKAIILFKPGTSKSNVASADRLDRLHRDAQLV